MWQWRPIDAIVWDAKQPVVRGMLWSLFAVGWLAVPLVSLMINHFDLFGTRQVWLFWRNKPYTDLPFRTPAAYAHVRHPLYLGWGLLFWAIPTMTVGHLLFAASLTAYMMLAAIVEERDLVAHFGQLYEDYRAPCPDVCAEVDGRRDDFKPRMNLNRSPSWWNRRHVRSPSTGWVVLTFH